MYGFFLAPPGVFRPAASADAAPPPATGSTQTASTVEAPAIAPSSATPVTPATSTGVSMGSSTPSTGTGSGTASSSSAAQAPTANNEALAAPTDSTMTAVSAQLLLIGPGAWPFEDDRQAKLIAAIKGDLMYATGRFPDPLKYVITDVRSSSGSGAPPGRRLLQALNSLVTVQINTGSTNLVAGVRMNLVNDVQSGVILTRCKEQGLQLTGVQMASAIYSTPQQPKPDTRPQLAAGIAVAGAIVFAFVGWIIYLESEKSRSCCGYSWGMAGTDGKPQAKSGKPGGGGLRGMFSRSKPEVVSAGANGAENGPGKATAHNFDEPKQEMAMQPQGASALPASGIGRHRLS
ncbi:hypothetical protein WJX81_002896 [Elliptochloris bilobata]|uniref:Uncharacterized protein n=1 Tax=Elliptochloris bilobata TaxID=381761 RepID=A0AAW1QCH1_9CHLO